MNDDSDLYVGRSERSYAGHAILRGRAKYTADYRFDGQLYAAILRSPHASARIKSIQTRDAMRIAGVVMALDGKGAAEHMDPIPHYYDPALLGGKTHEARPLAVDAVQYQGQPVAVVVATDPRTATMAARRIKVDYEVRKAVVDARAALEPDAPKVMEDWADNVLVAFPFRNGDVEKAFAKADLTVSTRMKVHRHSVQPIETRVYNATWDGQDDVITLYATVQSPHPMRYVIAKALRMPENRLRVVAPHCGGSFGLKMHCLPEESLICLLSKLTQRPVKWQETREECLLLGSREQEHEIEIAVNRDGRILALRDTFLANIGAPSPTAGWCQAYLTGLTMPGPYDIADIDVRMTAVVTNKAPWNAARGFGKDGTAMALEHVIDKAARTLGLDPAEMRYRNFVKSTDFPKPTPTGLRLDSGDYEGATRKTLEMIGYEDLRAEQARLRAEGRLIGIGIGYEVVPEAGSSPGTFFAGFDSTTVKLHPSGQVTVSTGVTDPGTGNAIGIAQIVADELGVKLEDVRLVQGDTETCPFGLGNYAGRSIIMGGGAAAIACRELREKLVELVSVIHSVTPGSVSISRGVIRSDDKPKLETTVGEISYIAHTHSSGVASHVKPPLEATATCQPGWIRHDPGAKNRLKSYTCFANGAYLAVVEVDRRTGVLSLRKISLAHDCGKVINSNLVEGQIAGAVVMAIGGMISEHQTYSEAGHATARGFEDYVLPRAADIPEMLMAHHDVPNPVTLYGVKGAGESGLGGAAAALINAVNDALYPMGAEVTSFPLSAENLWAAMREATHRNTEIAA